jgi:hypothetical protein
MKIGRLKGEQMTFFMIKPFGKFKNTIKYDHLIAKAVKSINSGCDENDAILPLVEIGAPIAPRLRRYAREVRKVYGDLAQFDLYKKTLMRMGENFDVEPVIQDLEDENEKVRRDAIEILAGSGNTAGINALLAGTKINDYVYMFDVLEQSSFRYSAACKETVAVALVEAYKNVHYYFHEKICKIRIIRILGNVGDENTLKFIQSEYDDKAYEYVEARYNDNDELKGGYRRISDLGRELEEAARLIVRRGNLSFELKPPQGGG